MPLRWFQQWKERPLVGLDVGSTRIKAVLLRRRRSAISVDKLGIEPTPEAALTEGRLTDSLTISKTLKLLWQDRGMRPQTLAAAVGGEKVFAQSEPVPADLQTVTTDFVRQKAKEELPYPLDGAVLDFEEWNEDGPQARRVMWAACSIEQLEWIREAVQLSGKTPGLVDPEACALANAFAYNYEPDSDEVNLLLHLGAGQIVICLTGGEDLLYSRHTQTNPTEEMTQEDIAQEVMLGLRPFRDVLLQRAHPRTVSQVFVSGGPARLPGLGDELQAGLEIPVEELDPFRRIQYASEAESARLIREDGPSFAVAVGLALRSFQDL